VWVKICGIRNEATACAVAEAGASAIGLNFYPGSPRCIDVATAARIVAALPATVEPVGVFVNASARHMREVAGQCGLRTLQLHGDEPPEVLAELSEFRLIRAFRVGEAGLAEVRAELARLTAMQVDLAGCLIDARVAGVYGGTGVTAPWSLLAAEWPALGGPPLILAGGLTPQNVAQAVRTCRPWGVDVAGGVESAPGVKNLEQVRAFLRNARDAS
jgi:phosphoribosylanthranilate isomerase